MGTTVIPGWMVTGRTLDQLSKDAEGCQRLHKLVTGEGHFWLPEYLREGRRHPEKYEGHCDGYVVHGRQ